MPASVSLSGARTMPTPPNHAISPATRADVPAIAALLRADGLPHEDFAGHLAHFLVARDAGGAVVGAIGAEVRGSDALLRSLVVKSSARGAGLGSRLVAELERQAENWGVARWWLLTTTAEEFFLARGFRAAARTEAPAAIAATEEFRNLCPSVAVCLTRERKGAA